MDYRQCPTCKKYVDFDGRFPHKCPPIFGVMRADDYLDGADDDEWYDVRAVSAEYAAEEYVELNDDECLSGRDETEEIYVRDGNGEITKWAVGAEPDVIYSATQLEV